MVRDVITLAEIEAAAEALPPDQKVQLHQFLTEHLHVSSEPSRKARLVPQGDDLLLAASPGAPQMTPERVKQMLADWP